MILTFGTSPALARSMIFDGITLDTVNRAREVRVGGAGKSVNVARVARLLGHEVAATGIIGGDTGRAVVEELKTFGVADAWVWNDRPTRVCVTVIDQATNQVTELVEEAPLATPADARKLLDIVYQYAPQCNVIACAGTIAAGLEPDLYGLVCERALRANPGIHLIIDAKGEALQHTLSFPVIVKCNVAELVQTFGVPIDDALDQAIACGIRAAVISDGARPTRVARGNDRFRIDTPSVPVISPIGSGDAMAAGVAVGLERGLPIEQCARLGVACASANAMNALAGVIEMADVERFFAQAQPVRLTSRE